MAGIVFFSSGERVWVTTGRAQGLFLDLCSRITPSCTLGKIRRARDQARLTIGKANALSAVPSLRPLVLFFFVLNLGHIWLCSGDSPDLQSGITPSSVQGTIWDVRDKTQVYHMQGIRVLSSNLNSHFVSPQSPFLFQDQHVAACLVSQILTMTALMQNMT